MNFWMKWLDMEVIGWQSADELSNDHQVDSASYGVKVKHALINYLVDGGTWDKIPNSLREANITVQNIAEKIIIRNRAIISLSAKYPKLPMRIEPHNVQRIARCLRMIETAQSSGMFETSSLSGLERSELYRICEALGTIKHDTLKRTGKRVCVRLTRI